MTIPGWSAPERRYLVLLLAAMIPRHAVGSQAKRLRPGLGDLELQPFWDRYRAAAPLLLRAGLRASVWIMGLLGPLLLLGRPCTVAALQPAAREQLLRRAAESRWALLQEMVNTLKIVACLAYFHVPEVEAWARAARSASGALSPGTECDPTSEAE
jgi:hypothetical protein